MRYLSTKDVKEINQKVLDKAEGYKSAFFEPGKEQVLDEIIAKAKTYKEPIPIATTYLYNINKMHIFKSANKRTAFTSINMFLHKNKLSFEITDEEAKNLSKDIRNDLFTFKELENYLSKRIKNNRLMYA